MNNLMTSHECRQYHPALDKLDKIKSELQTAQFIISSTEADCDKVYQLSRIVNSLMKTL